MEKTDFIKTRNQTVSEFFCYRCNERKKSKIYYEYDDNGQTRLICNGCYGYLMLTTNSTIAEKSQDVDRQKQTDSSMQIRRVDMNMSDNSIERTSLCRVFESNDGQRLLYRLADIMDGVLTKVFIIDDAPKTFDNRTRLFWRNGPVAAGAFGIWEWSAKPNRTKPDTDYVETTYSEGLQVIEIIDVPGTSTIEDVINSLASGLAIRPIGPRTLFCVQNQSESRSTACEGVLCTGADIIVDNGKTIISKTVTSMPVYFLNRQDTLFLEGKQFYRNLDCGTPIRMVRVKEPYDIVREAIIRRTSWSAVKPLGIIKSTWRSMRDLITEMSVDSLYQEIAAACQCDESEAKEYVDKFLTSVDSYINHEDYDSTIMLAVLEGHPDLMKKCEDIVSERWHKTHQSDIDKAQKVLDAVTTEILKKQEELKAKESEITSAEKKLSELGKSIHEQEQLASDVSEKIRTRISEARTDAATFIAEMAFVSPVTSDASVSSSVAVPNDSVIHSGKTLDPDSMETSSVWKDAIYTLQLELVEAGVTEKYSVGFAAFLYSAYINHIPVLLAGPNGESIAEAFSAALFGRTAAIIDCSGLYFANFEKDISESEDEVFIMKNALRNEWITHIPEIQSFTKSFFIVHPFTEDLLIEPQSLFSYVLPVFTELFVNAVPSMKYVGGRRTDNFSEYQREKTKPIYDRLLKSIGSGMYTRSRLQAIITDFHALQQTESGDLDCLFAIFPYAFITDKHEVPLLDKLSEAITISKELKKELAIFMGADDE